MLSVLADTYRIATLMPPPRHDARRRPDPRRDYRRRRSWLSLAGLHF